VLSFKQDELAHFENDEEKATFMKERAKDYLVAMGCTNSNEFFYALAPHIKDENPHVHIIQSAYKRDGNLHNFFIGKRFDGGITDVFAD
ncbi:relaxase/mobilization nuclease domain-containing protein, partial [Klebsiella pneumoniae]|uniref:relaxase/mobilization nuclease domain-containing protein n=3 Tax=Gammaproteobacteria TaxID=1236 RepID=UPI0027306EA0